MISRRALIAAAGAASLPGCASPASLRIGYQRNGLLLAAKARGDIEAVLARVAKVAWREYPSGPPLLEAMSVGGVDFGGTGDTPPIFAQAAGGRIVYVAAQPVSGDAAAIVVPAGSTMAAVADLRGAKIAWTRGSSAERFARAALAGAGLAAGDVEAINLTPTQGAEAFAARAIDAWAIWDPFLAHAEVEARARVLVAGRGLARSMSFLLANRQYADGHGEILRVALDRLAATAAWATAHRGELAALIATDGGIDPAVAMRIAARQDLAVVPLTGAIVAGQQHLADALHRDGLLPNTVDVVRAVWKGWRFAE